MFIARAERTDLLQLGVRRWNTLQVDVVPVPDPDACILVWRDEPSAMPDVVVVPDGAMQSFFAWTATYAPHLTPISALARVAEHRDADDLVRADQKSVRQTDDPTQIRGYLGLIHAEVIAGFRGTSSPVSFGLTPFVSTFSWLALQQRRSKSLAVSFTALRERWDEARRLLDAHRLGYDTSHVEEVWSLITSTEDQQPRHAKDIRAFLESVRTNTPDFDALPTTKKYAEDLRALQNGPLEARIETFKRLAEALYEGRTPAASNAMILGFALSCISQGSFAHIGIVGPARVSDARPLFWYGWFDFARNEPTPGSPSSSSASLQLLRAAVTDEPSRYNAQISLDELRVLARDQDPFSHCFVDIRHPVRVAIAPSATCAIQPGSRLDRRQRSLFDDRA